MFPSSVSAAYLEKSSTIVLSAFVIRIFFESSTAGSLVISFTIPIAVSLRIFLSFNSYRLLNLSSSDIGLDSIALRIVLSLVSYVLSIDWRSFCIWSVVVSIVTNSLDLDRPGACGAGAGAGTTGAC